MSLRARPSVVALVVAMLVAVAAPLLASVSDPHDCLANTHDECHKTVTIRACCCLEHGERADEATPASAKAHVAQPIADGTMVVANAPNVLPGLLRHAGALTTSPRSSPPDLVTLFGTFLI